MYVMKVLKRNGEQEDVSFDKVLRRLSQISIGLKNVNIYEIAQKVVSGIYDGVKTSELDESAAQICSSMTVEHPEYSYLASRIIISNHQKNTSPSFSETIQLLHNNTDAKGNATPLVSDQLYETVMRNKEKLNSIIKYERDFVFDYFGYKTLEKAYLMRINNKVVERPQHLLLRVALGIHGNDIKDAIETYDLMSQKYFVHATPTLFNAGTNRPQCSSCFLLAIEDSISGIFDTIKECAMISKYAGGIGLHISNIRSRNSVIRGTNGYSSGIVPLLRVLNDTARYVDQAGKRNGSFAVYLEPWHPDIEPFLDMRKNHGAEEERARDLFYALWIPDLFMQRVQNNEKWSLMCPDTCKGLNDCYGDDFTQKYLEFERQNMYVRQVNAQDLWFKICASQIETGTPYMLYKDHVNRKNNQSNLGVIKSSNLCTEIMEYTSNEETSVCNLASICLPSYIKQDKPEYDFEKLHQVTKVVVKNLNKIIDINFYPVEKARRTNLRHRPLGIGVQGLADTFVLMNFPFDSEEAMRLNVHIFETIYHAALEASNELAHKHNKTYDSFAGSPASKGILQFDMWNAEVSNARYDWTGLKDNIVRHGLLNSLLIAPMPTASTSQIMGFNEAFEPFTSNLYKRKTLAGEFILFNKYLVHDLQERGIWNKDVINKIILNDGSVQNIKEIPDDIKQLYKISWELRQRTIIDQAAARGPFIDQSQSMNLFMENPDFKKMSSMHFYAWKMGLKTGMYYLRTKAKAKTQQFTMDQSYSRFTNLTEKGQEKEAEAEAEEKERMSVPRCDATDGTCTMCSA